METKKKKNGCITIFLAGLGIFIFIPIVLVIIGNSGSSNPKEKKTEQTEIVSEFEKIKKDSTSREELKNVEADIKKLQPLFTTKYDEFKKITWVEHKNIPKYTNSWGFYTYIGINDDGSIFERLVIRYYGDNWLFVKEILIKADDFTFQITGKMDRDNDSKVWEWMDVEPDDTQLAMIAAVISAKTTKVRFEGDKYYKDRTLTQNEIKGLKDTQEYYSLLIRKSKLDKELK